MKKGITEITLCKKPKWYIRNVNRIYSNFLFDIKVSLQNVWLINRTINIIQPNVNDVKWWSKNADYFLTCVKFSCFHWRTNILCLFKGTLINDKINIFIYGNRIRELQFLSSTLLNWFIIKVNDEEIANYYKYQTKYIELIIKVYSHDR